MLWVRFKFSRYFCSDKRMTEVDCLDWHPEHTASVPAKVWSIVFVSYPLCILSLRVCVTLSAAITGYHVNKHFNYASSAVHTLLSLSPCAATGAWNTPPRLPPRPQTRREEFVSAWSNGHICQETPCNARHTAGRRCVCICAGKVHPSVWLEPPTQPHH